MSQTIVGITRDEERRLFQLRAKAAGADAVVAESEYARTEAMASQAAAGSPERLTPEEQRELCGLEAKYDAFLEEGKRRLREAEAARQQPSNSSQQAVVDTLTHVGRGMVFWGSLMATAGPGFVGKKLGVTPEYKHWNWITHNLILGAMPVMTAVAGSGNHLEHIAKQMRVRERRIGLVVSCLTTDEIEGFGIGLCNFARQEDWRSICGVTNFEQLPIHDFGAGSDFGRVQETCDHMLRVLRNDEAVYVHCKAGKGRSWMVLMCYLCSHAGMSFDDAATLIRSERYQVSPSTPQVQFVRDFIARYDMQRRAQQLYSTAVDASLQEQVLNAQSPASSPAPAGTPQFPAGSPTTSAPPAHSPPVGSPTGLTAATMVMAPTVASSAELSQLQEEQRAREARAQAEQSREEALMRREAEERARRAANGIAEPTVAPEDLMSWDDC